jgi:hypothetical protein
MAFVEPLMVALIPETSGTCRERRRVLSRGCLAKVRCSLFPQCFQHVPSTKVREIEAMLKAIHAS